MVVEWRGPLYWYFWGSKPGGRKDTSAPRPETWGAIAPAAPPSPTPMATTHTTHPQKYFSNGYTSSLSTYRPCFGVAGRKLKSNLTSPFKTHARRGLMKPWWQNIKFNAHKFRQMHNLRNVAVKRQSFWDSFIVRPTNYKITRSFELLQFYRHTI